jgi:hypothetical protein
MLWANFSCSVFLVQNCIRYQAAVIRSVKFNDTTPFDFPFIVLLLYFFLSFPSHFYSSIVYFIASLLSFSPVLSFGRTQWPWGCNRHLTVRYGRQVTEEIVTTTCYCLTNVNYCGFIPIHYASSPSASIGQKKSPLVIPRATRWNELCRALVMGRAEVLQSRITNFNYVAPLFVV